MTVAGAIALAPVVVPVPTAQPPSTVQALAETRLLAATETIALPKPPMSALTATTAAPAIGGNIIPIYWAIQPWVQYGFDLAEYVVGWIPVVGLFAPQITIAYAFIQPIVEGVVYSTAYLLQGVWGLGEALANVVSATVNSFGNLIVNEINWVLSFLPPLPPLPPFKLLAKPATSIASSTSAAKTAPATAKTATGDTQLPKTTPSQKFAADTATTTVGTGLRSLTKAFAGLANNVKTREDKSAGTPTKNKRK